MPAELSLRCCGRRDSERYEGSMRSLRIITLGYIVRGPVGGLAWHHLQYVMGLARLGHDVYFVEDSDDYPSCYDPSRQVTDTDPPTGCGSRKRRSPRRGSRIDGRTSTRTPHAGYGTSARPYSRGSARTPTSSSTFLV